ncbi:(d)CMP kinase [Paenibacillus chitinolyticus]|uniref:Cytidylate kinase n=1 Tax=Paenibacillus chitinolyticus TaxID=79263 RepID=A0A410WUZ3_9BACL|nr:(d)CMP kinase [Paenibacillus chitinolyticus]MCY9589394.1 (d)CMP kinase [Paenibacillus chitinolyticus]MCY9594467.1 (d)CMP kinase [Paenibacillus chitinolyticus]QAV18286.1 (d)CMP kinase [Paenibacillus chitinolyticus]
MTKFNIAIDGPAGAGKSTIARKVAGELGFVYVDTGAMYRAVTWKVLQDGVNPLDTEAVARTAAGMKIELVPGPDGQLVFVDGRDVSSDIRTKLVTDRVSQIAAIAEVRKLLVDKQKQMAASKGIVMDGRDIGTHVLPDAEVKVFLTASVRKRAERRFQEVQGTAMATTLEEMEKDIARRDMLDEGREVSPLVQAADAVMLDSTDLTIPEVVESILEMCRMRTGGERA